MKKNYFLLIAAFAAWTVSVSQNTVTVNATVEQTGYANVFETPAAGGAFVFGQPWGVPELKTVVDGSTNTITLQPNFNTYGDNPTDPFWVDQTTGEGNKVFEGNTYLEDNTLVGSQLTFEGTTLSKSISADYDVVAFIKVFNGDFSFVKEQTVTLIAGENFSVVYTDVEDTDAVIQYGFKVTGVNANPADESALGTTVVGPRILNVNEQNLIKITSYPNPVKSNWNVSAQENISSIAISNTLGQIIAKVSPDSTNFTIAMDSFKSGIYFAEIVTEAGKTTVQLIKE